MVYSGALGKLIHEKTRSRKSRETVPLKGLGYQMDWAIAALSLNKGRCAADFSLLNLPKGKSLGRSKPATNS